MFIIAGNRTKIYIYVIWMNVVKMWDGTGNLDLVTTHKDLGGQVYQTNAQKECQHFTGILICHQEECLH